jgi:cytochrome P450
MERVVAGDVWMNFDETDMFNELGLVGDPHPFVRHLRAKGPATRLPTHNVLAVTGYDEGLAVWRDDDRFSAINLATGPFLPLTPVGDDITAQIEEHRAQMPLGGIIATEDPPLHTRTRSLLMGILTPRRMKQNEEFMWRLADQQIDGFIDRGRFEVIADYGLAFAKLTIADLLGVPEADHHKFRDVTPKAMLGEIGKDPASLEINPLAQIGMIFYGYLEERRREPRKDLLTELAQATYSDGSLPPIADLIGITTFLFAAGQDTTTHLFTAMLRYLAEDPELQRKIRNERALIPGFIEEVLRLEGAVKTDFRLSKVPAKVGDVDVPAGATVMMMINGMNRDPRRFENPDELRLDRKNVHEHVAFARGIHTCPGAPLSRAEGKVTLERLLDRTSDIRIDEAKHGPRGARRYEYLPSYTFRGLKELHLEFTPA